MTALRDILSALRERADKEPLEVDLSDFSDEYCEGFLDGQVNALMLALDALDGSSARLSLDNYMDRGGR